jgi:hypothetical protein
MRVRGVKLRAGEELSSTMVVKPSLARLEARDYGVTRSRVMLMHADLVKYHSSRRARIRHICEDAATTHALRRPVA